MSQIWPLTEEELSVRIQKNHDRLCEPYYQIGEVFAPAEYDWPGDKEGRALLAFVDHYKMTGAVIPCLPLLLQQLDDKTNGQDFFGPLAGSVIFEQQLSGHSWYLRGLCEAYEQLKDEACLRRLKNTFEGLYLPTAGHYAGYPIQRPQEEGGVSGHSALVLGEWRLSTDVGCAFMSIDGLSHYYAVTRDARALTLLDEMITVFDGIDKVALKAQTHCSLTAARGMLRLYEATGEQHYLQSAQAVWQIYLASGMTYTYQNHNWWGRPDTWTEPCAIVDSLILALQLYEVTGEDRELTLARRIWHNGLASAQRPNGGAGTDTVVSETCDVLQAQMYEAFFCCSMRLAEGLWWAQQHATELGAELTGELELDELGRWHDGDLLYAEILEGAPENLPEKALAKEKAGHCLTPLVKYYRLDETSAKALRQQVLFRKKKPQPAEA